MSRLSLPDLLKQCTPEERVGLQKLYDDYNRCLLSEYKFTLAGLGAGGLLAARTRRKQLFVLSSITGLVADYVYASTYKCAELGKQLEERAEAARQHLAEGEAQQSSRASPA